VTGALDWISEAARWLASWIPRLLIVLATERGVRFRHGNVVSILEPGLRVYWPIVTKVRVVNVMRSVQNLSTQTLTTHDGVTVIVSGVLVYNVADVKRFLVENHDAEAGIDEVACAGIRQVVLSMTLDEIREASIGGGLADKLRAQTRKLLAPFGVRVEYCRLTDCAPAQVHSLQGIPNEIHITQYAASRGGDEQG
jgi:regulator of protease activity HflC (stomatin/prohibitin superfamily)